MPNCFLEQTSNGLVLKSTLPELSGSFQLDYLQGNMGFRLTPERVLHEPLAKVIDKKAWVIDTTGGLGRDGIMLAMMGCKVWMCEAHPLLYPLIQDALKRAALDPKFDFLNDATKFIFFPEDAKNILIKLVDLPKTERPEIVYLDPMFPARKKSSLVKKEMQWLKAIHDMSIESLSADGVTGFTGLTSEISLFEMALKTATKRVVVKRPVHAPNLVLSPSPNFSKTFQSSRFDVYLC